MVLRAPFSSGLLELGLDGWAVVGLDDLFQSEQVYDSLIQNMVKI